MKIGYVSDLLGKTVWEALAPSSVMVLHICAVPSMKKDETVANIGVVASKAPKRAVTNWVLQATLFRVDQSWLFFCWYERNLRRTTANKGRAGGCVN
jgi:hypothetical protein